VGPPMRSDAERRAEALGCRCLIGKRCLRLGRLVQTTSRLAPRRQRTVAIRLLGPDRSVAVVCRGQRPAWIVRPGTGVDGRPGPNQRCNKICAAQGDRTTGLEAARAVEKRSGPITGVTTREKPRPWNRQPANKAPLVRLEDNRRAHVHRVRRHNAEACESRRKREPPRPPCSKESIGYDDEPSGNA
jgi:hypothetical protein